MGALRYFAPLCMPLSLPSLLSMLFVGQLSLRSSAEVLRLNFGPPDLHIPGYEVAFRSGAFVQWDPLGTFYFGTCFGGYWSSAGASGTNHSKYDDSVEGSDCSIAAGEFMCLIGVPVGSYALQIMAGDRMKSTNSCFNLVSGESVYDATTAANEFKIQTAIVQKQSWIDNLCLRSCRDPSVINSWEIEKINCDPSCAFCTGTADWQCTISCTDGRIYTPLPAENKTYCHAREPYAPVAPTISEIRNHSVRLDWTEPVTGGLPITGYRILKAVNGATEFEEHLATTGSPDIFTTVTNLVGDTLYKFKIQGINAIGIGNISEATVLIRTSPIVPVAPGVPEPVEIDQYSMLLNWSFPTYDGGSAVVSYIVEVIDVPNSWSTIPSTSMRTYYGVTDTQLLIDSLQGYHLYSFRVAAVNNVGSGNYSSSSYPTRTLPVPPGPSSTPTISGLEQYAFLLSWTRPAFDGGATVTAYDIECQEGSVESPFKMMLSNWHSTAHDVEVRIPSLIGYTLYACRTAGINNLGRGDVSEVSAAARTLPVPPSAPGQPFGVEFEKHALRVKWSVPTVDVGSDIVGYKVWGRHEEDLEFTVLSNDTGSNDTEFYATYLEGFTPYFFKVAGINGIGLGGVSVVSNDVWTKGVGPRQPQAPLVFDITPSTFQVSWIAPMNGGSNITGYWLEFAEASGAFERKQWLNSTNLSSKFTGLLGSTTYKIRVIAVNAIDESPPGEVTYLTTSPPQQPDAATDLRISVLVPYAANLTWVPPLDEKGRPVLHYVLSVARHPNDSFVDNAIVYAPGTVGVAIGLLGSEVYSFKVQAVNEIGRSNGTIGTATMPPPIEPAHPGAISVTDVKQHSVLLSWHSPAHDGGSRLLSYSVWAEVDGSWSWLTSVPGGDTTMATVAGLIGDTSYRFRLQAENAVGLGSLSEVSSRVRTKEVPPFAPGQPQILNISQYSVELSWFASRDGGFDILGYRVWMRRGTSDKVGTTWVEVFNTTNSNATDLLVIGLNSDTFYDFKVAGINSLGLGDHSLPSVVVKTLPVPPDPVRMPIISGITPSSMQIAWSAPFADGGSAVLGYRIQVKEGAAAFVEYVSNTNAFVYEFKGLMGATEYAVRIIAFNALGDSLPGEVAVAMTLPPTVPTAPVSVVVTFSAPYLAAISWQPPIDEGGRPVLGYNVSFAKAGEPYDAAASVVVGQPRLVNIDRLLGAAAYAFRVCAFNEVGESNHVTVFETSPDPQLPATAGKPTVSDIQQHSAILSWEDPPHDGGSRINSFAVWLRHEGGDWTLHTIATGGEISSTRVSNLLGDTLYHFAVQAINSIGSGQLSLSSSAITTLEVPPFAPGKPQASDVQSYTLNLAWDAPSKNGGYYIEGYKIWVYEGETSFYKVFNDTESNVTSHFITGLKGNTQYTFAVAGINALGHGDLSVLSESSKTLPVPPDAPAAPVVHSLSPSSAMLSWIPPYNGGGPLLGYEIELARTGEPFVMIANISDVNHNLTGLLGSTSYQARLLAYNYRGHSLRGPLVVWTTPLPTTPSSPTSLDVTYDAPYQATLMWQIPEETGGRPILGYHISFAEFGQEFEDFATVPSAIHSQPIPRLLGSTIYVFRVEAFTAIGRSLAADMTKTSPAPIIPSATGEPLVTEVGQHQVSGIFELPSHDGGARITSFLVFAKTAGVWSLVATISYAEPMYNITAEIPFTAPGLLGDTVYVFRVQAINIVGAGNFSSISEEIRTLPVPPFAPQALVIGDVQQYQLALSWEAPSKDGGYAIMGYKVWQQADSEESWTEVVNTTDSNTTFWLVTGLMGNTVYRYKVAGINALGVGEMSDASLPVRTLPVPPDAPKAPSIQDVTPSMMQLSWQAPKDGGSPILSYYVEIAEGSGSFSEAANVTGLTYKLTGLSGSTQYHVRLFSVSAVGTSVPGVPAVAFTLAPITPEAPTEITVSFAAAHIAILQWSPPLDDGGRPIVAYDISYGLFADSAVYLTRVGPDDRIVSIPKLLGSTTYRFSVAAINEIGSSEPGSKVATTPAALPPAAPSAVIADDVQKHSARLSWIEPLHDGGSPILQYLISAEVDSKWMLIAQRNGSDLNTTVVSDLIGDTTYRFRIQATNAVGIGPQSGASNSIRTLRVPPFEPQELRSVDVGQYQLQLLWNAPLKDGGFDVHAYSVQVRRPEASWNELVARLPSNFTSWIVGDLLGNTLYEFRVAGVNAVGVGFWSVVHSVKTLPVPPGAPTALHIGLITPSTAQILWAPPFASGGMPVLGYTVELATDNVSFSSVADTIGNEYTFVHLLGSTEYQARVTAFNAIGKSIPAAAPIFTTLSPVAPGPPTGLNVSFDQPYKASFIWSPPLDFGGRDVIEYSVSYAKVGTPFKQVQTVTSVSPVEISDLLGSTTYDFQVHARNEIGMSFGATYTATSPEPELPAAPTIVSVTDIGQYSATITWDAPLHNGGAPVLGVNVLGEADGLWGFIGFFAVGEANSTSISGLLLGDTVYRFRLQAVNSVGSGPDSGISFPVRTGKVPPYAPSTPIAETVHKFQLDISWKAPKKDGGYDIVGYSVRQRKAATSSWMVLTANSASNATTWSAIDLEGNTLYAFSVAGINALGLGLWSAEAYLKTAPIRPTAPGQPFVSAVGQHWAILDWDPSFGNGANIISYQIAVQLHGSGEFVLHNESTHSDSTMGQIVTGLLGNTEYSFKVRAQNSAGLSDWSTPSNFTFTNHVGPSPPRNVVVRGLTPSPVTVTFVAPLLDGGMPVFGYDVYVNAQNENAQFKGIIFPPSGSPNYSIQVSNLVEGVLYTFCVKAMSQIGFSDCGYANFTPGYYGPPGKASSKPVAINLADNAVELSWGAAERQGGASITGWKIHLQPHNESWNGSWYLAMTSNGNKTKTWVTGLPGDTEYRAQVQAFSSIGDGALSDVSDSFKIWKSVPSPPVAAPILSLAIAQNLLWLTWQQPPNGGWPIDAYEVQCAAGESAPYEHTAYSPVTQASIGNIVGNVTYRCKVRAINRLGQGDFSPPSNPVLTLVGRASAPDKPVAVSLGSNSIRLSWLPPYNDGGSTITGYILWQKALFPASPWTQAADIGSETFHTFINLLPGTMYTFRVAAVNAYGIGLHSEDADGVYSSKRTPGPPKTPTVSDVGSTWLEVAWGLPVFDGGSAVIGYSLEMKDAFSENFTVITNLAGIGSNAFNVTELESGSMYSFRARVINFFGEGELSAELVAWTLLADGQAVSTTTSTTRTSTTTYAFAWTTTTVYGSGAGGGAGGSSEFGGNDANNSNSSDGGSGSGGSGDGGGAGAGGAGAGSGAGNAYTGTGTTTSAFAGSGTTSGGDSNGTTSGGGTNGNGNSSGGSNGSSSNEAWKEQFPSVPSPNSRPFITNIKCNSVDLQWSPPSHEGASPILGYAIWAKELTSVEPFLLLIPNTWNSAPQATVTGLRGRVPYSFRVQAINSKGAGFASQSSLPAVTTYCEGQPFGPDGSLTSGNFSFDNASDDWLNGPWDPTAAICMAPTDVVASLPGGVPMLSWTAPACSPKYGYRIWVQRHGFGAYLEWPALASGGDTTVELAGLTDKDTWLSFQIQAIGAAGPGILSEPTEPIMARSSSNITDVTKLPRPGQPQLGGFIAGRHLVLSWSAPNTSQQTASPLGYRLLRRAGLWSGNEGFAVDGATVPDLSTVSHDLIANQRYEFAVQALWPGNIWGLLSEVSLPFVPSTLTRKCSSSCKCSASCDGPCLVQDYVLTSTSPASCGDLVDGCPSGLFADVEAGLCVHTCPLERPYWTNISGVLGCASACPSHLVADGLQCSVDCSKDADVLVLQTNLSFFTCTWANESYPRIALTFDLDYYNQPALMAMRVVQGISAAVSEPTDRFGIADIREGSIIVDLVIFKFPSESLSVPQGIGRDILDDFKDEDPTLMNQQPPIFPSLIGVSVSNAPFCVNGNCTLTKPGGVPPPPDGSATSQVTTVASAIVPLVLVAMAMGAATWWWQRKGRPHPAFLDKLKSKTKDPISKFEPQSKSPGGRYSSDGKPLPPFLDDAFDPSTQQVIDVVASPKTVDPTKPTLPPYPRRWILEHLRKRQYPAPPQPPTLPVPPQPPSLLGGGSEPLPRRAMTSGDWVHLEEGPRSPAASRDRVPSAPEVRPPTPPNPVPSPPPTPPLESPRDGAEAESLWKCTPPLAEETEASLGTPPLAPQEALELSRDPAEDGVSEGGDASTEAPSPEDELHFFNFKMDGKDLHHAHTGGSDRQPESEPATTMRPSDRIDEIMNEELSKLAPRNLDDDFDDDEDEDEILRLLMAEGDCPEVAVPPPRGHAPWVLETWKPFYRVDKDEASDGGSPRSQDSFKQNRVNEMELPNCISTQ